MLQIESHLALLKMLPIGSPGHDHILGILKAMAGLGSGPAANGQANNGHEAKSAATATLSTSAKPLSTPNYGRRATASLSTSVAWGHGQHSTTPLVVTSPTIPASILHASPQPEVSLPIPNASPQSKVPPPIVDATPQLKVPPPILDASPQPEVPSNHPTFTTQF